MNSIVRARARGRRRARPPPARARRPRAGAAARRPARHRSHASVDGVVGPDERSPARTVELAGGTDGLGLGRSL
jgi:hypothetical protein